MKRIFFVAGERSGDTHAAHLITALRARDPELRCEGLGGEQMQAAGMALRHDLAGEAIMGFTEVLKRFAPIRRLFLDTVARLRESKPDCLVLVDYPGFNMQLAKKAHALGIPVVYYISPQVWAWKKRRVYTLARCVDKMLVIFPFEQKLYQDVGLDCAYVGHPLLEQIAAAPPASAPDADADEMLIGVLPGSREQEIARLLGVMLEVAAGILEQHPHARFATSCVDAARVEQVRRIAGDFPLETGVGEAHRVMSAARFCMVASGTATLETALLGAPMVIMYKVGPINYLLARLLVRLEHIGMVNILAGRGIVPEFIQHDAVAPKITPKALELIADGPARTQMLADFGEVRAQLGGGRASVRAADEILSLMGA